MTDVIEYLHEKARELREFVRSAPEIKDDLLRIAQELEEEAAKLEKNRYYVALAILTG